MPSFCTRLFSSFLSALCVVSGAAILASCTPPKLEGRIPAITFAPDKKMRGTVDEVWLINTGGATVPNKHLYEGGDKTPVAIPLLCALVKKGDEYILIDTGLNHNFAFSPKRYLGSFTHFIAPMVRPMPRTKPGQDVVAQLVRLGISPEQVSKIILSHAHLDHTGELPAFHEAQILLGPGERQYVQRAFGKLRGVMRGDFPEKRLRDVSFDSGPFLTFSGRYDLFGDGSFVIVPTPGHTPGSISVFVRTADASFLFVGDAAFTMENITRPVAIGFAENRELAWETLLRLKALHEKKTGIRIIPFHEPAYLDIGFNIPHRLSGAVDSP